MWTIAVYRGDGLPSVRRGRFESYGLARNVAVTFPPGWIWHIEEVAV